MMAWAQCRAAEATILQRDRARSLATDRDITFIIDYDCARCGAALEARSSPAEGWLRCPQCGRAGLPPPYMNTPRPRARAPLSDDVLFIGPTAADAAQPRRSGFGPGSLRRISTGSALFFVLLTAYLGLFQHNSPGAWVFGTVAAILLVLALIPPRST
jgi:hypothetical protein